MNRIEITDTEQITSHRLTDDQDPNRDQTTSTETNSTKNVTTTTRSNAAHRGITIRGSGPASGQPRDHATDVDLCDASFKIDSGWSTC